MSEYKAHRCDFCTGTVEPIVARSEPIHVRDGIVLLEGVTIGKCNHCGHTYFPADIVKRAEQAAAHPEAVPQRATIPIVAA